MKKQLSPVQMLVLRGLQRTLSQSTTPTIGATLAPSPKGVDWAIVAYAHVSSDPMRAAPELMAEQAAAMFPALAPAHVASLALSAAP